MFARLHRPGDQRGHNGKGAQLLDIQTHSQIRNTACSCLCMALLLAECLAEYAGCSDKTVGQSDSVKGMRPLFTDFR
jgi:hypothetical protein